MVARKRVRVPVTGVIWTAEDLAVRWQATVGTVEKMCRDGRLRGAFKVGRQWRLSEEALLAYERAADPFGSVAWQPGGVA